MNQFRNKKYFILLLTIVFLLTIGFAVVATTLNINGSTTYMTNCWNVKFDNIILGKNNTVTGTQTITDNTTLDFSVALKKPGDKYSFTVDIVNDGCNDAMLDSFTIPTLTADQEKLLDFSVKYRDGFDIEEKDGLKSLTGKETILVSLEYKKINEIEDFPENDVLLNFSIIFNYVQADATVNNRNHLSEFITKAKAGNATDYYVGKEFDVELGSTFGTKKVRVLNVSSPSACDDTDFSETSCGVILGFAESLGTHIMNSTNTKGGWPSSAMYSYLNTDIYNILPTFLKDNIITTKTISGHGSDDSNSTGPNGNWVSNDKIFLLDPYEIYVRGTAYGPGSYAKDYVRQLDFYNKLGVTTDNYDLLNNYYFGWTRSAHTSYVTVYTAISSNSWLPNNNIWSNNDASISKKFLPAFRIA